MRVVAILLGTTTRKVLDHAGSTLRAKLLTLETANVGGTHRAGAFSVFAKCAIDARPARLRGQIDLRVEGHADTDRYVFLARDIAKLLHQRGIIDGRQAGRLGTLRTHPGRKAGLRIVAKMVPRVAGNGHRDA